MRLVTRYSILAALLLGGARPEAQAPAKSSSPDSAAPTAFRPNTVIPATKLEAFKPAAGTVVTMGQSPPLEQRLLGIFERPAEPDRSHDGPAGLGFRCPRSPMDSG